MVTVIRGFNDELAGIPHVQRYMFGTTARLGILPFSPWTHAEFGSLVKSFQEPRRLRITQNGVQLWSGMIPIHRSPLRIEFSVARRGLLVLRTTPGAVFASYLYATGWEPKLFFSLRITSLFLRPLASGRP
jgi:hypothetical protein